MHDKRFYDSTLAMIEGDAVEMAIHMLVGQLHSAKAEPARWSIARQAYLDHPLRTAMLEDPYIARCVTKPRGYAGDAELIDMIYEQRAPSGTSPRGTRIFKEGVGFPTAEAVRMRKEAAIQFVGEAVRSGQRILSMACGHFREGDPLIGQDLSRVDLVDQDALSLAVVRGRHGGAANCYEANVFSFLRKAAASGKRYDLIYTLGLTDYLDDRALALLHRMVSAVLAPGGTFMLANFVPNHLSVGWMEAVMDWHLIYREPEELADLARAGGFVPEVWLDPTGAIGWCRMQQA
jgi:extracellular factor (EF) 3-hydroxypalmitic acid methyl ester biosynthesis protein